MMWELRPKWIERWREWIGRWQTMVKSGLCCEGRVGLHDRPWLAWQISRRITGVVILVAWEPSELVRNLTIDKPRCHLTEGVLAGLVCRIIARLSRQTTKLVGNLTREPPRRTLLVIYAYQFMIGNENVVNSEWANLLARSGLNGYLRHTNGRHR